MLRSESWVLNSAAAYKLTGSITVKLKEYACT